LAVVSITTWLLPEENVKVSVAGFTVDDVGVKVTATVQELNGASEEGQLELMLKRAVPERDIEKMPSAT
jgi:hypothetical protein